MIILDTCTAHTSHSPETVFARWADPESWPQWDIAVREVTFTGQALLGAPGRLRPVSGPAARFTVTAYEPGRLFTTASALPGARLIFEHRAYPAARGTDVEVVVGVEGPLAPLWKRLLGRSLRDSAQSNVTGLLTHLDAA